MRVTLPKICLLLAGMIFGMGIMVAVQRATQPREADGVIAQRAETSVEQTTNAPQALNPQVPQANNTNGQPDAALPRLPGAVAGRMMEYEQTVSGYPIAIGRRAVDSDANGSTAYGGTSEMNSANATYNAPVALDENGTVVTPEPRPIGRNGLISNPAMDPPSSKGTAYSRAY